MGENKNEKKKARKRSRKESDPSTEHAEQEPKGGVNITESKNKDESRTARRARKNAIMEKIPKLDSNGVAFTKEQLRQMRKRVEKGLDPIETDKSQGQETEQPDVFINKVSEDLCKKKDSENNANNLAENSEADDKKAKSKEARAARRNQRKALMEKVPKVDEHGIGYTKLQLRRMRKRVARGLDPIESEQEARERLQREAELQKEEEAELAGMLYKREDEEFKKLSSVNQESEQDEEGKEEDGEEGKMEEEEDDDDSTEKGKKQQKHTENEDGGNGSGSEGKEDKGEKSKSKKSRAERRAEREALMEKLPKVDEHGVAYTKQQLRRMRKRVAKGLDPIETEQEVRDRLKRDAELCREEEAELAGLAHDPKSKSTSDEQEGDRTQEMQVDRDNEDDQQGDDLNKDESQTKEDHPTPQKKKLKRSKPVPADYVCYACQNKHKPAHWIYDCPDKVTVAGTNKIAKNLRGIHNPDSRKTFVSGLPFGIKSNEVVKMFASCGMVKHCKLIKFQNEERCKGQAILTFENEEGAQKALKLSGTMIDIDADSSKDGKKTKKDKDAGSKRRQLKLKVTKTLNRTLTKNRIKQ